MRIFLFPFTFPSHRTHRVVTGRKFFPDARPPELVDRNESHGGRVCRPEVMGETTLSRLNCKRSFRCSVF